jgi:hypothetical protein
MQAQMLAPAAVLVLWSLVMLLWTAQSRFGAMAKSGLDLKQAKPGGRGQDLDGVLPDSVNWKSHNYTHLMEQPTIFYPTVVILAVMGAGAIDVALAWAYVAIRVIHSLYQATVNRVPVRFSMFLVSTICLIVLAVRAVIATLLHDPTAIN